MKTTPRQRAGQVLERLREGHSEGFTLVELMVTLIVTSIALLAIYGMMSTTTQSFYQQELTSENQGNVRFSSDVLRLDLMRAGLNASPNTTIDNKVCPKPTSGGFAGITIEEDLSFTLQLPDGDGGTTSSTTNYDGVTVVGDPTGLPPYRVIDIPSASQIVLEPAAADRLSLLQPPNVLRVTNPDGFFQFVEIADAASDVAGVTVNLSDSLTAASGGSPCGYQGLAAQNHTANVVTGVAYRIEVDPNDAAKSDLVRYNFNPLETFSANTASNRLLVAEFVVGLNFVALGTNSINPQDIAVARPTDNALLDIGTAAGVDTTSNPQRARFLLYRLQTRSQRAVPRRTVVPSGELSTNAAELLYFPVGGTKIAQVRTIQGRIELPSLSLRNLR